MQVTQLATLINSVTSEVLGKTGLVKEDLSNVVDVGKSIVDTGNIDNYVRKLVNHIGRVIFVNRAYAGGVPSVIMDAWEFGSILEKVSAELPEAEENDTWNLQDRQSYDPNIFYQPKVQAKFFNSRVTFDISLSFTEIQIKESFSNAEQLNGFISMLVQSVENSMTMKLDSLIMRAINNMIAETVLADVGTDFTKSGVRSVNLLADFNARFGKSLKAAECVTDFDFIKYATYTIGLYAERMSKISDLFNSEGKSRFTPDDMQRCVLLADFSKASQTYLLADMRNPEMLTLPEHDTVPYWQGSGLTYDFADTAAINVKTGTGSGFTIGGGTSGIIGCIFDRDAVGVSNLDRRVTTNYNAKAEFYTNFYKFDAGYYNDLAENFVVFFVGE